MIYSSWDIEQNILKLVILGHFLPFYPLKTPKIKILKNEKICWRYHHFTHVYQKSQYMICVVPEIQSETDIIFCHFGQFFVLLPTPNPPPNDPKNQTFGEKKEKKCLEILSFYTYMCTINEGHIILLYIHVYHKSRSWHMVPEIQGATEQKLSTFWAIFCPFNPLRTWKIKILTLKKNTRRYYFTHLHHNWQSYDIWCLRYGV